jgi:hypothetical protein
MSGQVDDPGATLEHLATLVGDVIARVERLGLLHRDDQIADRFRDLVALHGELRARWPAAVEPPVATREELRERVLSLDAPGRLRALAQVLDEATLLAPDARSERRWDKLRRAAVEALRALADLASPPSLPGPMHDAGAWFPWAWSQRSSPTWTLIEGTCPDLFDFLEDASPDGWFPETSSPEVEHAETEARPEAQAPRENPPVSEVAPPPEAGLPTRNDPGPAVRVDPPRPTAFRPIEAPQRTGVKKLAQLTDEELASLFVVDTAVATKNADRLLGAPANRKDGRQREHFLKHTARAELEKRRKSRPIPIPVPEAAPTASPGPAAGPVGSVIGRLPAPAKPAERPPPVAPAPPLPVVAAPLTPIEVVLPRPTPPQPAPPPPGAAPPRAREPVHLLGFDDFKSRFWTGTGECGPAPWIKPEFTAELDQSAHDAAVCGHHHLLQVFVRAQEQRRVPPLLFPADVDVIRRMLSASIPAVVGRSDERRERIDGAARSNTLTPDLRWKVAVLLECLRPADSVMGQPLAPTMISAVGLDDVWTEFADQLTLAGQRGIDLLDVWRRQKRDETASMDEGDVEELRLALRELYRELYSAAGGRVERTHCRVAWSQFIETAKPVLEPLFPVDAGGTPDEAVDIEAVAQAVRRLPKIHAKIADRADALRGDRRDMDKAADALTDAAQAVLDVLRREQTRRAQKQTWLPEPKVVDAVLLRTEDELQVIRRVVMRILELEPPSADGLPLELLRRHPELLDLLESEMVSERGSTANAADLSDAVLGAALLLRPGRDEDRGGNLADILQTRGLAHLLPRLKEPLDDARREASQRAHSEGIDRAYQIQGTLHALYTALDHLGSIYGKQLKLLIDESERLVGENRVADGRMLVAWLSHMVDSARRALRSEWEGQLARATPELRDELSPLLAAEDWIEAARRLGGVAPQPRHVTSRVTQFRDDAAAEFGEPVKWLRDREGEVQDLVKRWLDTNSDRTKLRTLRSRFSSLIGIDDPIDRAAEDVTVECTKLRHSIDQNGMNPCFLPQLAHFRQLRIETIEMAADKPQFPNYAAQRLAKPDPENSLRIALAPRLTATNRQQLLSMLHQKKATAVLVDDLDLCRLVLAKQEAHLTVLGLLEIALEQLAIEKVVPFETAEGQHTPAEMFVGREQEARDLATTKTYTRVFSGRKLGKSALLRAVQHRFANKKLPDGKSLRVLYVSLVGVSEERDVVDEIVKSARSELHVDLTDLTAEPPRQRLQRLVTELTRRRPAESFFFVCDESDQFVENEIRVFEARRKEDTLSWAMRGLEQHAVRFVFAGYRSTHRNEGVWENWGVPLLLQPLERSEAENLVVGPLARIGIDAAAQGASIAHRCGYQPAILLRFGRALLDEIRKDSSGFGRGGAKVDAGQVSRAYAHSAVQGEIRTVVMANFHGNPLAQVVFCAALLELTDLPPGTPLQDASDRIVRRIDDLGDGKVWTPADRSPQAFVEEILGELADRQLLIQSGRGAYQLRIPHHLPVLLDEDPERVIRDHLKSVAAGTVDFTHSWKGLLEPGSLDRVRDALGHATDLGLAAVVAGSAWSDALVDRNGLQRALGLERDDQRLEVSCTPATAITRLRSGTPSVLFGGPELVRWAIGREADPSFEHQLEVVELRRISMAGLGWWLQRARGLEFKDRDATRKFWQATRGIPDLVGVVDRVFVRLKGETLGTSEVEASLREVTGYLEAGGPAFVDLQDRAMMKLVIQVADSGLVAPSARPLDYARDLGDVLTDPSMLRDVGIGPNEAHLLEDAARLRYLMAIGWLPRATGLLDTFHAVGPIDPDDPARRLVAGA